MRLFINHEYLNNKKTYLYTINKNLIFQQQYLLTNM